MTNDIYLPDALCDRLVEELTGLEPDPATGIIQSYQVTEVLGEICNIWPAEVLNDPRRQD